MVEENPLTINMDEKEEEDRDSTTKSSSGSQELTTAKLLSEEAKVCMRQ